MTYVTGTGILVRDMNNDSYQDMVSVALRDDDISLLMNDGTEIFTLNNLEDHLVSPNDMQIYDIEDTLISSAITVYPNPTSEFLSIQLPQNVVSDKTHITLYDINGRLVKGQNIERNDTAIRIKINHLSNGVYLVHVVNNHQKWSQLFIKK